MIKTGGYDLGQDAGQGNLMKPGQSFLARKSVLEVRKIPDPEWFPEEREVNLSNQ